MISRKRASEDRGHAELGWLHARFTFSFAEYKDPAHDRFHSLLVMNNDVIEPGGGFAMHPHDNAEIFTYVMSGRLEHKDSIGNGSVIQAGDLQYMSAGNGVLHSEFNPSKEQKTELYQIWMEPSERGGNPRYAEKKLGRGQIRNALKLLFSGNGREGSTIARQEADFYFGQLDPGLPFSLEPSFSLPHLWIQMISGDLSIGNERLKKADGLAVEKLDEPLDLVANQSSEYFLFRLP